MALMNLEPAYDAAKVEFAKKNPLEMANNSLSDYDSGKKRFTITFLGQDYFVYYPEGTVKMAENEDEVHKEVQILLLHYLSHADPEQLHGKLISFKELPSGMIYIVPFTNRAIRPLVGLFGSNPDKLLEAAKIMGGKPIGMGDAGVTVPVLPKIPVTFVIWEGDDEFPPTGNVLYDSSASMHLHTEDYAWLPGLALLEMKRKI